MADTIYTSQTPAEQASDGTTDRNIGMRFQVTDPDYQVTSGRIWVSGTGLPGTAYWQLWDSTGPTKLAQVDLNSLPTPTNNAWMNVPLATPEPLTEDHNYYVSYFHTVGGQYVYTSGGSLPTGTGVVSANNAIYTNDAGIDGPPEFLGFSGYFFADVNVDPLSTVVDVGTAAEIDTALSIGANQRVAVGTATEVDAALPIGVVLANTVDVGTAAEVDTALPILANQVVAVGTAAEVDSALSIGVIMHQVVPVGVASEVDTALPILFADVQTVDVGTAAEVDVALPIGVGGGPDLDIPPGSSATYILNALAGSLVGGLPTLTAKAAASQWAGLVLGAEQAWSFNDLAGNVLPQWLAIQGVLNQLAGTKDLSVTDALKAIAEA